MYLQYVERSSTGTGYKAELVGRDGSERLRHSTLGGLKIMVLILVDDKDAERVERLFAAVAAAEKAFAEDETYRIGRFICETPFIRQIDDRTPPVADDLE